MMLNANYVPNNIGGVFSQYCFPQRDTIGARVRDEVRAHNQNLQERQEWRSSHQEGTATTSHLLTARTWARRKVYCIVPIPHIS